MNNVIIVMVGIFLWYIIDLDYDASDYHSLERMVNWSPSCKKTLLNDMAIASDGSPSMGNLHGLNCDQIHELAMEVRAELNEKQSELLIKRNTGEFSR